MFFFRKAARIQELERKLDDEMKELHARLLDPDLPDQERKRIQELIASFEAAMRNETRAVRETCGMEGHKLDQEDEHGRRNQ